MAEKPNKADKAEKGDRDGKSMGARVRRFREAAGLSQTELGDKLGVSYQQVQKYERGVSRLGVDTLLRLARALDQPVSVFLPLGTWVEDAIRPDPGAASRSGHVAEPRADYAVLTRDEKEMLKAFRELGDEKLRSAFLATLKAAASRKH
jgi:transcriptional regulator with XRE-family HTH domain